MAQGGQRGQKDGTMKHAIIPKRWHKESTRRGQKEGQKGKKEGKRNAEGGQGGQKD